LTLILTRVDDDGIAALWWGVALNGSLARRAQRRTGVAGAHKPVLRERFADWTSLRSRIGIFATAALPIALQLLYVVCPSPLPQPGAVTSFSRVSRRGQPRLDHGVLLGLVSSVPLTASASERAVARHVPRRHVVALA
jgi:hypothetical protein